MVRLAAAALSDDARAEIFQERAVGLRAEEDNRAAPCFVDVLRDARELFGGPALKVGGCCRVDAREAWPRGTLVLRVDAREARPREAVFPQEALRFRNGARVKIYFAYRYCRERDRALRFRAAGDGSVCPRALFENAAFEDGQHGDEGSVRFRAFVSVLKDDAPRKKEREELAFIPGARRFSALKGEKGAVSHVVEVDDVIIPESAKGAPEGPPHACEANEAQAREQPRKFFFREGQYARNIGIVIQQGGVFRVAEKVYDRVGRKLFYEGDCRGDEDDVAEGA